MNTPHFRRFLPNELSPTTLILLASAFLVLTGNVKFFAQTLKIYPPEADHALAVVLVTLFLASITVLFLSLICFWRATKPLLILLFLVSSLTAYFSDSYGIIIDSDMLRNVSQTNFAEARDLFNIKLLAYLLLIGILPSWWIHRIPLPWRGLRAEATARAKLLFLTLLTLSGVLYSFGGFYISFGREHSKTILAYANPVRPVYAAFKYARTRWHEESGATRLVTTGTDAHIPASDTHRELLVLVVGETARADHFSLNGYTRDTNPKLRQENVVSFNQFESCGTATVVSVPCMFSVGGQQEFVSMAKAASRENLLDVLQHAGVNVLWMDNNSDSKGVASRIPYKNYQSPEVNSLCDSECRDEGMLVSLQSYIDAHPTGDIVIVLHQMGNHGPAYFKRYPAAFEKFKPACQSNDLGQCTRDEIHNAYDNALLYTDHFLASTIALLKKNDPHFETALLYISDHGESLGENGLYLHGLPRTIAPKEQTHVPAILWFGRGFLELDRPALMKKRDMPFTHDNIFHTVLGLLEIETSVYRPEKDILNGCRKPESRP